MIIVLFLKRILIIEFERFFVRLPHSNSMVNLKTFHRRMVFHETLIRNHSTLGSEQLKATQQVQLNGSKNLLFH